MPRASPRASCAVVLVVGARLCGQASFSKAVFRIRSACSARKEPNSPTIPIKRLPDVLSKGTSTLISGVLPLFERQIMTSFIWIMPKSPWMASAACINMAGVPVELKVATIFWAIMALLPIPVTITRPLQCKMLVTTFSKSLSIFLATFNIAAASSSKVLTADCIIDFLLFKEKIIVC
ncbi:hypothetical protein D3C87_1379340 [compost metagenome]